MELAELKQKVLEAMRENGAPVSYTHLDVYKRQDYGFWKIYGSAGR